MFSADRLRQSQSLFEQANAANECSMNARILLHFPTLSTVGTQVEQGRLRAFSLTVHCNASAVQPFKALRIHTVFLLSDFRSSHFISCPGLLVTATISGLHEGVQSCWILFGSRSLRSPKKILQREVPDINRRGNIPLCTKGKRLGRIRQ